MLLLTCPYCGVLAEETEFQAGGQAHLERFGPGASDADFTAYLFERANPKGIHFERWRHVYGCGKWLHVARCTVTLEIFGAYRIDERPPEWLLAHIDARRPGWRQEAA